MGKTTKNGRMVDIRVSTGNIERSSCQQGDGGQGDRGQEGGEGVKRESMRGERVRRRIGKREDVKITGRCVTGGC